MLFNNFYLFLFLTQINITIIMSSISSSKKVHPKATYSTSKLIPNFVHHGLRNGRQQMCYVNASLQFIFLIPSYYSHFNDFDLPQKNLSIIWFIYRCFHLFNEKNNNKKYLYIICCKRYQSRMTRCFSLRLTTWRSWIQHCFIQISRIRIEITPFL